MQRQILAPLKLAVVAKQQDNHVIEGVLHCTDLECQLEYPIIDGIPIIVPYIRKYLSENYHHITARDDLPEILESILGDGIGPGTFLDATRQHLSTYAWDHYSDLEPGRNSQEPPEQVHAAAGIVRCLHTALQLLESKKPGAAQITAPLIDIGCSVGRIAFELANRYQGLSLGIDVDFSMLRVAHRVLRERIVRYPLKRIGIVYDRQEFNAEFAHAEWVDFWACDALALPFMANSFGFVSGFNVFDSVTSPRDLLASIDYVIKPGGWAVLATPYDWSAAATPVETWIGGHSQRGPDRGSAEPLLRKLLTRGAHPQSVASLEIAAEIAQYPWMVRVHERSNTLYRTHIIAAKSTKANPHDSEKR